MHYLIALLCLLLTIPGFTEEKPEQELILSTPEQLSALTSEPGYLVGGLVSPMSGHPSLRQTDLVVKGAQDILLTRVYIPPYIPCSFPKHKSCQSEYDKKYLYAHLVETYKGWQFFPHLRLQFNPKLMEVRLSEPNGSTLDFRISGSKTTLASPPYAISNFGGDEPKGKYDPRNTRISYEDNGNKITVYATDGTVRFYYKKGLATRSAFLFLLDKEILPSGKVLKYHYNEKRQPTYVESLDPQERYVYASLCISGSPLDDKCHFTSSSGMTAEYHYQSRPLNGKIKEKTKGGYHREEFSYFAPPVLTSVSSPFYRRENLDYCDRFLLATYYGKDSIFTTLNGGFGSNLHYRVHKLSIPVGLNDAFEPVYELNYTPPIAGQKKGSTHVKNSDGTYLIYHFSKNLLMTSIQYFEQNGELKKEKVFSWDDNNLLKSIVMRDGQKNPLYTKSYEFDGFGNPILETFTGDLTGEGSEDSYTTYKEFSQDGRHLLLKEEHDNGKIVCFSYLPNSNLITKKLTKDTNDILLREFSKYDDCHNLIQTLCDNGKGTEAENLSGVTQRTITNYTLRQLAPFLHMPEWIEEKFFDGSGELLLIRKHIIYDKHGNVAQEEVYDANEDLAYTIYKEYNDRGDLLSTTNPLGQKATYRYDSKGRRDFLTNFSGRLSKKTRHDTKGRIKEEKKVGDDGITHETLSEYDFHDRLIQKKDPFHNSTRYTYDPLVSQISKTDFPIIASLTGQPIAVSTQSSYDPFGRELTKTDATGNTTTYRYNSYGSPTLITYPNGGKEFFLYEKTGALSSHTDQGGLTIRYTRDVLGQILSKTYVSPTGELITEETFTYNGFNLLTETDKEGNLTKYEYDGAGRKIKEDRSGHITDFSYDGLGRLICICKQNGENSLFIHYKKDLEGRILEECKTDSSGEVLYKISRTYDQDGNEDSITRYINDQKAVNIFTYDSFGRLIQHVDPSSYITGKSYEENHSNGLGQRVLLTTTTDPRGIKTIEILDAFNRLSKKEVLSQQGATLSCQEMTHDPHGNLTYQKDHVFEEGQFKNTQTIQYTYTPAHQVESLTRAFGTNNTKITTYTYLYSNKLKTKTLPSGITLSYEYHPLGFLRQLSSSDGKILHAFEYDNLGYVKYAADQILWITISREVDPFGNVTKETFPSGLEVNKRYDDFNRLIFLELPENGTITYNYDPLFLRDVTRYSKTGAALYSHKYENYNIAGNLVSEKLIRNLGQVTHKTNLNGLKEVISGPYFSQSCSYDSAQNLIENIENQAEYSYSYDGLSQISSEIGLNQSLAYNHDSLYNRTAKDEKIAKLNDLNELISVDGTPCSYDLNGNQILKKTSSEEFLLTYDPLNQLVEATSSNKKIIFVYDPLGRCLSRTLYSAISSEWEETEKEHYLYDGQNEIGAFVSPNKPKNLRVLGILEQKNNRATVAIELTGQMFAPILDVQGNVRKLVDIESRDVVCSYEFTAFGEPLEIKETSFNPWRFASKRLDPELSLVNFGKRYYDPESARWMTPDPAGFIDSVNLYQYVFNNPFLYSDPDGQFIFAATIPILVWGAELVLPSLVAYATPIVCAAISGAVAYAGYKIGDALADAVLGTTDFNSTSLEKRSAPPDPDPLAEGNPHTIIQIPGATGSYTTHNGDGTFKQYRGSGKPHGDIPRPNVKENTNNPSPSGPRPGKPEVRKPRLDEIPTSK